MKEQMELLNKKPDKEFSEFLKRMAEEYGKLELYYKCAIMEIETKLNVMNEEFSLVHDRNPISSIQSRLKKITSIKEKLERKNQPLSLDAIQTYLKDVAGIRVICSFLDDVYMVAESLSKQDDIKVLEWKDYIKNPKPNGYRSLHLIVEIPIFLSNCKKNVKAEIQFRTIAMDCWASLEHQINYKKGYDKPENTDSELKCCAELSAELDLRMNQLQKQILDKKPQQKK